MEMKRKALVRKIERTTDGTLRIEATFAGGYIIFNLSKTEQPMIIDENIEITITTSN